MPVTLGLVSAGVSAAKEGVDFFSSLAEKNKNKRALSKLERPFARVQDEYFQNRNIAGTMGGLPDATKDYLTDEARLGVGTGINAIQEQGGSPNDIAKLFQGYDRSISRVGAEDAQARVDNIKYFMNVNKDLAGQKTTSYLVNELQPYEQKLKQLTQNISNARSNMSTAGNNFTGSLSAGATAIENDDLMKKLFPEKQSGGRLSRISDPVDGNLYNNDSYRNVLNTRFNPQISTNGRVPIRQLDTGGNQNQDIMDRFSELEELLKRGGQ